MAEFPWPKLSRACEAVGFVLGSKMEVGVVVPGIQFPFYYGFLAVHGVLVGAWVKLGLERFVCLLGGSLNGGWGGWEGSLEFLWKGIFLLFLVLWERKLPGGFCHEEVWLTFLWSLEFVGGAVQYGNGYREAFLAMPSTGMASDSLN